MQRFYLTFSRKTSFFGPNGSEGHSEFFRIKTQNLSISPKYHFGDIIERFGGFYSQKFKFCDLLNHLDQKNLFYVKMWDRTFAFSAHAISLSEKKFQKGSSLVSNNGTHNGSQRNQYGFLRHSGEPLLVIYTGTSYRTFKDSSKGAWNVLEFVFEDSRDKVPCIRDVK